IHIDHGLHPQAGGWAEHCRRICARVDVPLRIARVEVRHDGSGPEAAARRARRQAFAEALAQGEVLVLAQHRDDQAETFLLHALRGSGTDGLASMRPWRTFASGWLWRPLLGTSRAALRRYAEGHDLAWIDDPSNDDTRLDRNFLRHRVMPLLRERWPQTDAAFARAAEIADETAGLLTEQDAKDLAAARAGDGASLSISSLRALSAPRRGRVLRQWVASMGWPPLPGATLARIECLICDQTRQAIAMDRIPLVGWHHVGVRRWRDGLYPLERRDRAIPKSWSQRWDGRNPIELPNGDRLALSGLEAFAETLCVHARRGGERIRLPGRTHRHLLKQVLQDLGVPPWERERMPLLSTVDGLLLAAGDRIHDQEFARWLQTAKAQLVWTRQASETGSAPSGF
ncbi:MAG: tRNA lysidine(34) synthetase TilS, partial [Lysobacteraceae bacterium]